MYIASTISCAIILVLEVNKSTIIVLEQFYLISGFVVFVYV